MKIRRSKGKILLTNQSLVYFAGSELVTLERAIYFKKNSFSVVVATFCYDYPIKDLFEKEGIRVVNLNQEKLNESFDYCIAHHPPTIREILLFHNVTIKKMCYESLGAGIFLGHKYHDLERLPTFHQKCNLLIFNSQENYGIRKGQFPYINKTKYIVIPNSVNKSLFDFKPPTNLSKIAIISNHVPEELLEFQSYSTSQNLPCDIYGIKHEHKLVDKDILRKYDVIITIGRTVQMCFAVGIPVYCYDYFGGYGYITMNNIKNGEFFNFSGRGFGKKIKVQEIYDDLTLNFNNVLSHLEQINKYAKKHFLLERNMKKILRKLFWSVKRFKLDKNDMLAIEADIDV